MERFPNLWNVTAETSEKRNPTQIASTKGTYRNIYNILKREGFSGTILDASSGLGIGTELGRNEFGFDVDDIEYVLLSKGDQVNNGRFTFGDVQRQIENLEYVSQFTFEKQDDHRASNIIEIYKRRPVLQESFHSFGYTGDYIIRGGVYTEDVEDVSERTGENERERIR